MAFNISALKLTTIKKGSEGPAVKAWQNFLKEAEYPVGTADGDFGPRSTEGLAEAYLKRDVRMRGELEQQLSSATKQKLGSDLTPGLDIFNGYAKKLRFRLRKVILPTGPITVIEV